MRAFPFFGHSTPCNGAPCRRPGRAAGESREPSSRRADGPRIFAASPLVRGDGVGVDFRALPLSGIQPHGTARPTRHPGRAAGESREPSSRRADRPRIFAAVPLVRGDDWGVDFGAFPFLGIQPRVTGARGRRTEDRKRRHAGRAPFFGGTSPCKGVRRAVRANPAKRAHGTDNKGDMHHRGTEARHREFLSRALRATFLTSVPLCLCGETPLPFFGGTSPYKGAPEPHGRRRRPVRRSIRGAGAL